MRYLLDTCTFLWLATDSDQLTKTVRRRAADERNELFLSLASAWEIAIKASLGKLTIHTHLSAFLEAQIEQLQVSLLDLRIAHVVIVRELSFHHRDPFDRLLIAQALHEGMPILGPDPRFDDYGVERIW
jgi:PIN domain nuclease of toxin-antitoxin system